MDVALWIVQVLLALVVLASGIAKLTRPRLAVARQFAWVEDFSDAQDMKMPLTWEPPTPAP